MSAGLLIVQTISAQNLIEDFENGNLTTWQITKDSAEATSTIAFNGTYSARLHRPDVGDAESQIIHRSFSQNFGTYELQCLGDGPVSDVDFLFQYIDADNYYRISYKPLTTDNPELAIIKRVNGLDVVLGVVPPKIGLDAWFKLGVDRLCSGEILVYVDDIIELSVVDRSHTQLGTIGLSGWTESSYFDDIYFTPSGAAVTVNLEETICSGRFYEVGSNRYSETGSFIDTLTTAAGCDSIVHLDLTVSPHFLVTEIDTICSGQFYLLGTDTIRESGRFSKNLISTHGCDSIVEISLTVTDQLTTLLTDTFCPGSSYLFYRDTIRAPGTYSQILTTAEGCDSIVQLALVMAEPSLNIGPDLEWCFADDPELQFSIEGRQSYLWSDGSTTAEIEVREPGLIWLETSEDGCIVRDSLQIIAKCGLKIFVPNAFTPNGDGINDMLEAQVNSPPSQFRMQVFNRWGGLVFQSETLNLGWDGSANDRELPPDVYLWVIEADDQISSGDVLLVR
ncbi:MAG: gliding motility-associated C-terminal domain-containing protein [Saprospiraceae bacterium]|nr:gliding motility-associated C-terminal domain-containing protein [Saprospiraceae bacterium]